VGVGQQEFGIVPAPLDDVSTEAVLALRREADEGSVIRIPAQTIERTVTDEIKRLLSSSQELLKMVIIGNLPANKQKATIRKAKSMADTWSERPYPDKINLLKKMGVE